LPNILFICSKNQWRSPTAELLFKNHPVYQARSAGTGQQARTRVNEKLINWADIVFVMEQRHKQILKQNFWSAISKKTIVVLDIEDNYRFNDPELVVALKTALAQYL
jgi:predicted protein tyrosine phosphatase